MPEQFIILNRKQVLKAICMDLHRYELQTMLIAELLRLIYGDPSIVQRDPRRAGMWIKKPDEKKIQYYEGKALAQNFCEILNTTPMPLSLLVEISRRVFQTPIKTLYSGETDETLVQIDTGMTDFHCRCCGNCCRNLDYHREIAEGDIQRWQSEQRNDILRWVGETRNAHSKPEYRVWIMPGTNQFTETCPFLTRGSTNDQWLCGIENTKPDICRQYPFSRKHAVMTGCQGFSKQDISG